MEGFRRHIKGFSLLEIISVLVIIGILAAVSMPILLTRIQRMSLENATTQVSSHIRLIRSEAIREGEYYMLDFSDYTNAYMIRNCSSGCFNTAGEPILTSWSVVDQIMGQEPEGRNAETGAVFLPNKIEFEDTTETYIILDPRGIVDETNLKSGFPASVYVKNTVKDKYKARIEVTIGGFVEDPVYRWVE